MNEKFRRDMEDGMMKHIRDYGGEKKMWLDLKQDNIAVPSTPDAIGVRHGDYPLIKKVYTEIWGRAGMGDITPQEIFNDFRVGDLAGTAVKMILGMTRAGVEAEHKRGIIKFARGVEDYFMDNEEHVFALELEDVSKNQISKLASTIMAAMVNDGENYVVSTLANFWTLREHLLEKKPDELQLTIISNMRIPWVLDQSTSQVIASLASHINAPIADHLISLTFLKAIGTDQLVYYADEIQRMNDEALFHASKIDEYKKFSEYSQITQLLTKSDDSVGAGIAGKYQDLFFRARASMGNSDAQRIFHFFGEPERHTITRLLSNQYLSCLLVNIGLIPGQEYINLCKKWMLVAERAELPKKLEQAQSLVKPHDYPLSVLLENIMGEDGNQEN